MLSPDELKMVRARKVVDHGTGPHAIPLAQLTESILINESLANLTKAVEGIGVQELPEYPEIEIPEYPTEITVANLPDVQKVEITNLPETPDTSKQLALLKEIASELKKKEQYAYDIEVDSDLKEQLRGEQGVQGPSGSPDTPEEIKVKLERLEGEERLDASAIKGLDNLVKETKVYGSRLLRNLADVNGAKQATTGQVLTKQVDGTFAFETTSSGSGVTTFETVSKNLAASQISSTTLDGQGRPTILNYANGVIKTISYTDTTITVVLSGSIPSGIDTTKVVDLTDFTTVYS